MEDHNAGNRTRIPSEQMRKLEKLVGTWRLDGDTEGTVTYEWMEGGFFLMQRLDFRYAGHDIKGVEIIGHLQPFGESPSNDIRSRVYDSAGNTMDYVYELEGDVLTIWGGEKGSPAYFKGVFTEDGNHNAGEWVYPGGGYKSTMTRITIEEQ